MQSFNVMALFCEDIREEKSGTFTLISILPDNVTVAKPTNERDDSRSIPHRALSRICVYVRINFDPNYDLPDPSMRLVSLDGNIIELGNIGTDVIARARDEAKARGNTLAGVIFRAIFERFQVHKSGAVTLEIQFGDEVQIAGALNFHLEEVD